MAKRSQKMKLVYKSSKNGKFVSKKYATKHKTTTYATLVKATNKKKV